MDTKKALYEQVAEALIAQLEAGTSPFQKPWSDRPQAAFLFPYNPTTGKNYKGMNTLWLCMQAREDPRWLTFKQAENKGWTIKKGSKGTIINFVKTHDLKNILDERKKPILDGGGCPLKTIIPLARPVVTFAWVFNAEHVTGIPELKLELDEKQALQKWSSVERAEIIAVNSGAKIKHGGNQAYYRPGRDYIQLPEKEQFDTSAKYYSTLLHELGHWTGHKDRLDRTLINKFGTAEYAREELRAEISSLLMGSELNIGHDFSQHAAYVESWIKVLKEDPFEIHRASAQAQHISDYLLAFEQKILQKQTIENPGKNGLALVVGEVISYKNEDFKVLEKNKSGVFHIEKKLSGEKFKLRVTDGLYASLLEVKQILIPESSLQQTTVEPKSIKR